MNHFGRIALGATLLLCVAPVSAWARCTARIVSGPVKIRPYATLPAPHSAPLVCARNEYCSFQVVITAEREDCRGADVEIGEFRSDAHLIPLQNTTVYRQEFLNVFYRSSEQGDLGEWPDPLIPKIDPDYGEHRKAFPADVARISRAYKRYAQQAGGTRGDVGGAGRVTARGNYSGGLAMRYVLQIVQGGKAGEAMFRWYSQPGPVNRSPVRLTGSQPISLERGVQVSFSGAGTDSDFTAGDEFWIYAGPARHQPVWVDVLIPADSAPATYSADVRVTFANAEAITLPVQIEVVNFTLPSTPSLANSFLTYWPDVARMHLGSADTADAAPAELDATARQLVAAYAQAALRNGITLDVTGDFLPAYTFHEDGSIERADYAAYDRARAGWLSGQATPRGARWTSLVIPKFSRFTEPQLRAATADFIRHAREQGWNGQLFDYVVDEPRTPAHFEALRKRAALLKELAPEVPRLVTISLREDLVGVVTRWCPLINSFEPDTSSLRLRWRSRNRPRIEDYAGRVRAGDSLWLYQSCMSHGCGGTGRSPHTDNWPSYMLDASAVANRVFGLMSSEVYRASGVLYWGVTFAYRRHGKVGTVFDPRESIYYFGGNGDGTLFYPGLPETIGGTRHIAVESLRMKFIRDSFVDAELARALRERDAAFAEREVGVLVQSARRWNSNPDAWSHFRNRALRRLAGKQ